jgi:hypothetical protein
MRGRKVRNEQDARGKFAHLRRALTSRTGEAARCADVLQPQAAVLIGLDAIIEFGDQGAAKD